MNIRWHQTIAALSLPRICRGIIETDFDCHKLFVCIFRREQRRQEHFPAGVSMRRNEV